MNIKQYTTAYGNTLKDLDASVNSFIRGGYQPFGNPYFIGATAGNVDCPICQAMVKCECEPAGSTLTPSLGARVG